MFLVRCFPTSFSLQFTHALGLLYFPSVSFLNNMKTPHELFLDFHSFSSYYQSFSHPVFPFLPSSPQQFITHSRPTYHDIPFLFFTATLFSFLLLFSFFHLYRIAIQLSLLSLVFLSFQTTTHCLPLPFSFHLFTQPHIPSLARVLLFCSSIFFPASLSQIFCLVSFLHTKTLFFPYDLHCLVTYCPVHSLQDFIVSLAFLPLPSSVTSLPMSCSSFFTTLFLPFYFLP